MRLAVSNIGWRSDEDTQVLDALRFLNVHQLEIAPTRLVPSPSTTTKNEVLQLKEKYKTLGFDFVASQSLLFGKPDLVFFKSIEATEETIQYLKKIIDFCSLLGIGPLVFGSPKNRLKGSRSLDEAMDEIRGPLREIGSYALSKGCTLCIEPNPAEYGCTFINSIHEAITLLDKVDHPGVRLNIDLGAMVMNHEPIASTLKSAVPYAGHFHISEANLAPIAAKPHHEEAVRALKDLKYNGIFSIEMRCDPSGPNLSNVESSVRTVTEIYRDLL